MSRRLILVLIGTLVVVVGVGAAAVFLLNQTEAKALPGAETALESGNGVTVETEPWYTFVPDDPASTGFILYPGARVDPTAYAPSVRGIAEDGFLSVIVPMPFGIAALGAEKADEVMEANPEIDKWVIGGHSIGGAMAVQYTDDHTDIVDGIALWGAYPSPDDDISDTTYPHGLGLRQRGWPEQRGRDQGRPLSICPRAPSPSRSRAATTPTSGSMRRRTVMGSRRSQPRSSSSRR